MGSTEASIPYGKRLLHSTIDEIADVNPDKLCACIPRSPNLEEGFKDVTIADFARAIDRTAWWLQDLLGKSTTVGALAYIGPFDLRYFILVAASAKAEYRVSEIIQISGKALIDQISFSCHHFGTAMQRSWNFSPKLLPKC